MLIVSQKKFFLIGKKLIRHYTKEDIQMVNKQRKDAQHYLTSEKWKLNPYQDTCTNPWGWAKLKRTTISIVGKALENLRSHTPVM